MGRDEFRVVVALLKVDGESMLVAGAGTASHCTELGGSTVQIVNLVRQCVSELGSKTLSEATLSGYFH